MKILFLSDYFSTWNIGGATRVLDELIHGLLCHPEQNFEIELISGYPGNSVLEKSPCVWHRVRYKSLTYIPALYSLIRQRARDFKPDIVHIHQPLIGWIAHHALPAGIPRLYHFHSFWHEEKMSHARGHVWVHPWNCLKRAIEDRCLKHSQHAVALSAFSKDKLTARHPQLNVSIVPGSIRTSEWTMAESPTPRPPTRLLCVRRLDPRTGVDRLLRAFDCLGRSDVELDIVGTGRCEREYRELAGQLQSHRQIHFHGRLEHDLLLQQLRSHHAMIIPSRELEGFGMSVIEAFAMGLPVLATRVGGLREFEKHPEVFFSCESAEETALLQGLRQLLEQLENDQASLRSRARSVAENHYDTHRTISNIVALYRKLLPGATS